MGRRCLERRYEFCADVDAVLRVSKGLMGFWGALRDITPGEKGAFETTRTTSVRGGWGATAQKNDSRGPGCVIPNEFALFRHSGTGLDVTMVTGLV